MPYQPTFPTPYLDTIDATADNVFRCRINARDKIIKYVFKIYEAATLKQIYTTTGTSSASDSMYDSSLPLSAQNGEEAWLEVSVPSTSGMSNGTDYIWSVTLTGSGSSEVKSPDYYFKARSAAVINLNIPDVINSSVININATYTQAQNVEVEKYCFNLYLGDELVDTTGDIYSANIAYSYSALISDNSYEIELLVTDSDGVETVVSDTFSVLYDYFTTLIRPTVSLDPDKGCVVVDYSKNVSIDGQAEKNKDVYPEFDFMRAYELSTFKNGANADTPPTTNAITSYKWTKSISWNMNKAPDALLLHWHGHEGFIGVIVDMNRDGKNTAVRYDGTNFYYSTNDSGETAYSPYTGDTKTAIISDAEYTSFIIDKNALYVLSDADSISDDDHLVYNDISYDNWWVIAITPSTVKFFKTKAYDETVVSKT